MKLDQQQLAILSNVRRILEFTPKSGYICLLVEEEMELASHVERRLLRNRILFWKQYSIYRRWIKRREALVLAIEVALDGVQTVGTWFDDRTKHVGLNLDGYALHNQGLYRLIRMSWIDRIIETGEIA